MLNKRSELYGESVFTSFRSYKAKVPGLDFHLDRLRYSVSNYYLYRDLSRQEFESYFQIEYKLKEKLKTAGDHYFRITIYAETNSLALNKVKFGLGDLGVKIIMSKVPQALVDFKVNTIIFSFSYFDSKIKAGSFFQNLHVKRSALNLGFSDSLLVKDGNICELSTSNVILERGGAFKAPVGKNIFQGITILLFEKYCKENKIKFEYTDIEISKLSKEDRLYGLNSVTGIVCINQINELVLNKGLSKVPEDFRRFLEEMS